MPTVNVSFSNRPQHVLRYVVNQASVSADGNTVFFNWSMSVITSNNTREPFGTGNFNNTTSPATTQVSGNNNTSTNFSYDYRGSPNRDYFSIGAGTRSAATGSSSRTFSITVSMGSLIGSASASITMPVPAAPAPPPPPENPQGGAISVVSRASNSITIGWFTTENPTSVEVRRDGTLLSTASNNFNFLDAGLSADAQYSYTLLVRKTNFADLTDTVVTRTRRPAPSLSISATALTSVTAQVSWSSSNADSVSITGPGLNSTDTSGSVTVTGLSPSTVYRWDGSASNTDSLDSATQTTTAQSNSIQTPATLGGVWDGGQWAFPTLKAFNGSSWVTASAYVYDGTNWKKWV